MWKEVVRTWDLGVLAGQLARGAECGSVVERLAQLHGLPQKIGQVLSLRELETSEKKFTRLTEGTPALRAAEARAAIEKSIGKPIDDIFSRFEPDGISASLGQVHRARLLDGTDVAVKVLYPGIREALSLDLKALGWIASPIGNLRQGFNLKSYQREVGAMLESETDYGREMLMMRRFLDLSAGLPGISIPRPIPEFCSSDVLVMTWMPGESFDSMQGWTHPEKEAVARWLSSLFIKSLFSWKVLHSDPHPGNYRFIRRGGSMSVGLLDFGCVKEISADTVARLAGLIGHAIGGNMNVDDTFRHYVGLGFNAILLEPMRDRLPKLTEALFEPFQNDGGFLFSDWEIGRNAESILGEHRAAFRFAGPAELIYFIRAFQGVVQYLRALRVPVRWRPLFEEYSGIDALRKTALQENGPLYDSGGDAQAGRLRIRIVEFSETRADLTFAVACVENLADLVPSNILEKLAAQSIDVDAIAHRALAGGCAPGVLFELQDGQKLIKVWLE